MNRVGKLAIPGFLLALAALLGNAVIAVRNTKQSQDRDVWVQHTQAVLTALESLQASVSDAATAQRGYLITGEETYLPPYRQAVASHEQQLDELLRLTRDSADQQSRLRTLRVQLDRAFAALAEGMAATAVTGNSVQATRVAAVDHSRAALDEVRHTINDARAQEQHLLTERVADAQHSFHRT